MERVAQGRESVALLPLFLLPMIAMLVLPIGWRAGVRPRKTGAARMLARAARQRLEVVLESPVRHDEHRWPSCHLPAMLPACCCSRL